MQARKNAAWCDLVCAAETGLNRRSMTMLIKITLIEDYPDFCTRNRGRLRCAGIG
jgi:hypothetical protein